MFGIHAEWGVRCEQKIRCIMFGLPQSAGKFLAEGAFHVQMSYHGTYFTLQHACKEKCEKIPCPEDRLSCPTIKGQCPLVTCNEDLISM